MSGDVQPRKRKDKKRKKDELGVEEHRGTAAALGEGDVFMHSHHDHGTGGHWCAKIIFFSLLAVLITLIGLIILENRGLTELEANSVESRYSGVLNGWLEDAPDDDHHDEHTLELLKHHDIENDHEQTHDISQEDQDEIYPEENESGEDHDDEDDNDQPFRASDQDISDEDEKQDDEQDNSYEEQDDNDDEEESDGDNEHIDSNENEQDDDNSEELQYEESDEAYNQAPSFEKNESDEEKDDDDIQDIDEGNTDEDELAYNQSIENDGENSRESANNDEEDDEHEEEDADSEIEVEKLETEASDEDAVSAEQLTKKAADDDNSQELSLEDVGGANDDDDDSVEDVEFLEDIDEPLPVVEHITVPKGKPLAEMEDEEVFYKPADTLLDEEEYEKQQEELRRDEAQASHEDGGNSIEDDWPGEPSDKYWREQLDEAENKLRQGSWSAAISRVSAMELRGSGRARWLLAQAMDAQAEAQRDNRLLSRAIAAYLDLLKLNEHISDVRLREVTSRTLDRIKFRGNYQSAEPVYRLLIRRFPDVVEYRNNLTVSFLMANRADIAEEVTRETLQKWPDDRLALAHIGFILKTQHNRLEEAVEAFQKALEGDVGPATEPRFYYHLGDSLLLLNRFAEAHEVHQRGAKLGHFLSPNQRSLYNVERLKSRPWWNIEQTPYLSLARALEKSWKDILKEGQAAQALYEKEKEGLKERGEWSQLDIFVRGQEVPGRCKKAPVTCSIVRTEKAASGCRRGQVKFSAMESGTHVRPHVGPTNCRLRMHLGLSNTKDTYIRVDQETRQWQAGKVFIFDDSFEHEVWHNGTDTRLVLIVDVWHPELTADERRQLAPI